MKYESKGACTGFLCNLEDLVSTPPQIRGASEFKSYIDSNFKRTAFCTGAMEEMQDLAP